MATKKDYYEVLGVAKNVSADELKSAYRKKAMQYHPDRNPGDKEAEAKFKEAAEAYEVLHDPDKRAAYDKYGHAAFDSGMGGTGGAGGGFSAGGFTDFNDIFSQFADIFGGGGFGGNARPRQRSSSQQGSDLRYNLEITLEEAFNSVSKKIRFNNSVSCDTCKGTGSRGGKAAENCSNCNGSGFVRRQQGFFIVENTCSKCQGTGKIIKDPCPTCHGEGRTNKMQELEIKVPAGVADGERLKLSGKGEAGLRGGAAGDLYVFVSIKQHNFFTRKGNDLYCELPIKVTRAILGGDVEVPTIEGGKTRFKVTKGAQTGTIFRLANKGMTAYNNPSRRGDLYVKVLVETPVNLSSKAEKLLEQLDAELGDNTRPKSGFFDKFFN